MLRDLQIPGSHSGEVADGCRIDGLVWFVMARHGPRTIDGCVN
jgi:hypothetical protein